MDLFPGQHSPADAALLRSWLDGEVAGSTAGLQLEGPVVVVDGFTTIAIRIDGGVLMRCDVPDDCQWAVAALEQVLASHGWALVETQPALAGVVGIEESGLRGVEWDLWAGDAAAGRAALARRALGEFAELIDLEDAQARAEIDAAIEEIERRLEP
jgi:hypothetical protein